MSNEPKSKKKIIKNVAAAIVGNALEWYDFLIFAFMTPFIAHLFFPVQEGNPDQVNLTGILYTTAIFGVGFFMRPIGGLVLGWYADQKGRKAALVLITAMMALALALICFAPTYEKAGILAPLMILVARLVQGFSAGGVYGTATSILIEMAPKGKKSFYGSWQMTGQMLGLMFGALAGILTSYAFTEEQINDWAWRIPFFLGLVIIPLVLYIRKHLDETDAFLEIQAQEQQQLEAHVQAHQPLAEAQQESHLDKIKAVAQYWRELLKGVGIIAALTVTIYITFTYLVTYTTQILHIELRSAFVVQMLSAVIVVICTPLFGLLADRYKRRTVLLSGMLLFLVLNLPLYYWLTQAPSAWRLMAVQVVASVCASMIFSVSSTVTAVLFPTKVRTFALSIFYNFAVLTIGGFAQFIVTWLIQATGSSMAPAYYVSFGLLLGAIAAYFLGPQAERDDYDEHTA
ncbi:MFS transporter [Brackiella oedipodis]|uniref:MFS transporter n=1 Tax=Brackiella oedipodis TaxID=124225 RepID=UPI00056F4412|nr:MFS transporter [Brackiella oedipodis]